jgi:hypothetical protein
MRDPFVLANHLSKRIKALAQEFGFTPHQMRAMTLRDLNRFYSEYEGISSRKKHG